MGLRKRVDFVKSTFTYTTIMIMHLKIFLLISSLTLVLGSQPSCLQYIDFFRGEWNLVTRNLQRDGSYVTGEAVSTAYVILDGNAIQDDFRSLNEKGEVIFRGTSIRSCLEETSEYLIAWVMPGREGYTHLRALWSKGVLGGEGQGFDGYGPFRERFRYFNITDSSYSFQMDRSYDEGQTWLLNFSTIKATKKQ